MKKTILSLAFAFVALTATAQEKNATLKEKMMNYLEVSTGSTMETALEQVTSSIPERNKAAFKSELDAELDKLYIEIADLYLEEVAEEDLKAMLDFYETPAGKRILEKTPELTDKSMQMGQQWGMTITPLIQKYSAQ